MKYSLIVVAVVVVVAFLLLGGKGSKDGASFQKISQEDAWKLMNSDDFAGVVLDVRTKSEYDAGHIPGAICVPNETIADKEPAALKDKNQTILVYCRSGARSKAACKKLANMGYTDIRDFGGIMTWKYEVV